MSIMSELNYTCGDCKLRIDGYFYDVLTAIRLHKHDWHKVVSEVEYERREGNQ